MGHQDAGPCSSGLLVTDGRGGRSSSAVTVTSSPTGSSCRSWSTVDVSVSIVLVVEVLSTTGKSEYTEPYVMLRSLFVTLGLFLGVS